MARGDNKVGVRPEIDPDKGAYDLQVKPGSHGDVVRGALGDDEFAEMDGPALPDDVANFVAAEMAAHIPTVDVNGVSWRRVSSPAIKAVGATSDTPVLGRGFHSQRYADGFGMMTGDVREEVGAVSDLLGLGKGFTVRDLRERHKSMGMTDGPHNFENNGEW